MAVSLRHAGNHSALHPPQRSGDAGMDLEASTSAVLSPGRPVVVGTGVRVEIPVGCSGFILPRSGLASRGILIPNSPGLIDSGYRGEIKVGLLNATGVQLAVKEGDRIAQLVIIATPSVVLQPVIDLTESDRGDAGFGSTGR